MDKMDHLKVRHFYRVLFAREIWSKWTTGGFDSFKAYHLRGKHGQSGILEGSTILRHTIWEGNMDKVDHFRVRQR